MDVLKSLGLDSLNPGAFSGSGWHSQIEDKELLISLNPANGKPLARVSPATKEDYQTIMERGQNAFLQWRTVPAPKRGELIRQIADELRRKKDALGSLVSLEMGKSKQEGDGEVQEMIDIADFAVGQSRMLYGKTMHSERPFHRMYEQWHPYGVIGVISAFNFPVAVWAWNAFIAAICGNITLWKPSAKTPLSAIAVQLICNKILQEHQAPEIFSLIIPNSHKIAEEMVDDRRLPLISFTGSTAVGKTVAARVGQRLGKCILELGGNNAIILDESADLNLAIPAVVFGAVGTAGQRCTSTRRLFIHEQFYQSISTQLVKAYQQIRIGDPLDPLNLMGPLIDEQAVHQYCQAMERIKSKGGILLYGGNVLNRAGYFVEPTLVTQVEPHWDIVQEETFAPILYLMPYRNIKEAIYLQNNVSQGLSSALFTQDLKNAEYFLSALGSDCGIANVNIGTSGAEIGGAFGGEKETGGGREAGSDAWKNYMRRQTNTINWGTSLPLAQGIKFSLTNDHQAI